MNALDLETVLHRLDDIIDMLTEHEEQCYVSIELAYQLRDELGEIVLEEIDDE